MKKYCDYCCTPLLDPLKTYAQSGLEFCGLSCLILYHGVSTPQPWYIRKYNAVVKYLGDVVV
jgi:hypothetical protein